MKQALFVALLSFASCAKAEGKKPLVEKPSSTVPAPAPRKALDVADKDFAMPALPKGRVTLSDAFGGKHVVEVELAATGATRTRGLMWREQLAAGTGMFFLFPRSEQLSFWMKNTLIPLDIIFITEDFKVLGVVENASPQTLDSRWVRGNSKYVLEVPGGWSAKVGLKPGSQIMLEGAQQVQVSD